MNREHEAALLLESIFSEAVDMGADAIEFQPLPGEGLEFTFLAGKTEKSRILRDEALEKLILDRIINEAGLQKNKEGQFAIETERGRISASAKTYKNLEVPCYLLELTEVKQKAAGDHGGG